MFAMAPPLPLRSDYGADALRREARRSGDADQARRLLALATICDGGSRAEAARVGGVTRQIVRDWVERFNAEGPAGLIPRRSAGPTPKLDDEKRRALAARVESGPIPAIHGVVRWRLVDLAQWVWEEFRVPISPQTLSRELRDLGCRKLSARPRHHAQDPEALETFKKLPRLAGGDRGRSGQGQAHGALVPGRNARRPEEPDHPPLGAARDAAGRAEGPAHRLRLHPPGQARGQAPARSVRLKARGPPSSCPDA
jgi:transposase